MARPRPALDMTTMVHTPCDIHRLSKRRGQRDEPVRAAQEREPSLRVAAVARETWMESRFLNGELAGETADLLGGLGVDAGLL